MQTGWRRIRAALALGISWALVWGVAAVLLGLRIDPDGAMDEMWVAIGAFPGFLGGVAFAAVLGIAARRRRIEELSLPRVAAWGGIAGLLVGLLPFVLGDPTSAHPRWLMAAGIVGSITLLSAASAAGSLALARRSARQDAKPGARPAELAAARPAAEAAAVRREAVGATSAESGTPPTR